ncbi:hypothetical protein GLYMA_19G123500v4 [Glycine max]|nr:hypothetical protein GLYMA_19G123500v4 [Glycine max]KAH1077505.1 hypothetical protein GYH30_052844 [Glycine max]
MNKTQYLIVGLSSFGAMGVFENSTLSLWCQSNQHCSQLAKEHMGSVRETPSFLLGLINVIVWVVAEIPQIIPNYRTKSAEGLSVTFLVTWIIGDLFNLFGCMLEPATVETFTKVGQLEKASDAEQSIQVDGSNRGTGLSSPIPLPARPQRISTGRELFYQSARYLSKSHTPTAGSILAQKPPTLDSIQESLLGSTI